MFGGALNYYTTRLILTLAGGYFEGLVGDLGPGDIQRFRQTANDTYPHKTDKRWTRAGRSLQEHTSRPNSGAWRGPSGTKYPENYNDLARQYVDEILSDPNNKVRVTKTDREGWGGWQTVIRASDGRGIWFDAYGVFRGFLEP
jgi:hypothetical protein